MSLDSGYNSDLYSNEDKQFNHTNKKYVTKGTLSVEILVAVPNEIDSNKYATYIRLLDT